MSLSSNYDWIVLGDHPGALLSANLVARLGLSVLILPKCGSLKTIFSQEGQCLDPEPNFVIGIGSGEGLLRDALMRVAVLPRESDAATELTAADSVPQVLTPERRFLLGGAEEQLNQELEREFGGAPERELIDRALQSRNEVAGYWRQLPAKLTLDLTRKKQPKEVSVSWQDLLRKLQPRQRPRSRAELLAALGYGVSGAVSNRWTPAEWVHALALGQSGASIRGGLTAYRKTLLRSAKVLGATILEDAECRRIFVENRRFVGIQVSVSGNMIAGTGCLLGTGVEEFRDRLSFTGPKWGRGFDRPGKPTGWRFTIALTVREEALIPGMSRRMVWKEPDAPALEIETADPSEYGTKEPDHQLVFLRTTLPFTQESLTGEYQRTVASRMFRLATEIIPFLEYHVRRVYPDFRAGMPEIFRFPSVAAIPENLRVYESGKAQSSIGIEGIFVSSGESFPRLGSFGPTVAAMEATAWVAHRSGLAGPFA